MIYVYAVIDEPELTVDGLRGLSDAPLVRLSQGPVAAVCTMHDELNLETDAETLWRHEQVTASLMARCTVAPAQFGTVLSDLDALGAVLDVQGERLTSVLAALQGKVELAVRGRKPATGDGDWRTAHDEQTYRQRSHPASGRAYLRSLQGAMAVRAEGTLSESLAEVHATLAERAAASTIQANADGSMVAAYLVDRGSVASFRDGVIGERQRHHDIRLSLTGPWAPFSFVERGAMTCA
ncbi:MAG: GvpL/GvpF family gas vesicle protein [Actinomycetota bacterium]|nr:GvpL/GvpF family gas vesicle protein [Actinomycetota bacterium]